MSNMSYCRFQNIFRDLQDCEEHIDDEELSTEETNARNKLLNLCLTIAEDYLPASD